MKRHIAKNIFWLAFVFLQVPATLIGGSALGLGLLVTFDVGALAGVWAYRIVVRDAE